jgi:hypothetical protein
MSVKNLGSGSRSRSCLALSCQILRGSRSRVRSFTDLSAKPDLQEIQICMLVLVSPYLQVFSTSYLRISFHLVHPDMYVCSFVSLIIIVVPFSNPWRGRQPRHGQDGVHMPADVMVLSSSLQMIECRSNSIENLCTTERCSID